MAVAMMAPTNFTDGVLVRQADLNNLSTNLDALCQITTGKTAASGVASKPLCKLQRNAPQLISSVVNTLVQWDTEIVDTDNMWVPSVPDHMTVQTPGWYDIKFQYHIDAGGNAPTERVAEIFVNGTSTSNTAGSMDSVMSRVQGTRIQCVATEHLAAGATIYANLYQDSGVPLNIASSTTTWRVFLVAEWTAPY
jgi:hypothetical protein